MLSTFGPQSRWRVVLCHWLWASSRSSRLVPVPQSTSYRKRLHFSNTMKLTSNIQRLGNLYGIIPVATSHRRQVSGSVWFAPMLFNRGRLLAFNSFFQIPHAIYPNHFLALVCASNHLFREGITHWPSSASPLSVRTVHLREVPSSFSLSSKCMPCPPPIACGLSIYSPH